MDEEIRDHSEDLGIHRRIILEWIIRKRWEGVDRIHLAQDMNQWQPLVNMKTNLRVP
jgi:hypothetical protein